MKIDEALNECFNAYENFEDFVHDYAEFQIDQEIKFHLFEDMILFGWVDAVCFDEIHSCFQYNITTDCGRKYNFVHSSSLEQM